MKFLIKFLIIISFFIGNYLFNYNNFFSELICKISLYTENIKKHTDHIILQNKNINNITSNSKTKEFINEYVLTIFNKNSLNSDTKNFFESSDFSILNFIKNNTEEPIENSLSNINILDNKNFLIMNNQSNLNNMYFNMLNENLYRFFNYDNFSIAYLKPKILNNKDLLQLYRYINILKNNFYIPIILVDKLNLNENLIKNIPNKDCIFIVLDDKFSLSYSKNNPIVHLDSRENSNLIFQINMFISNSNLEKLRFKIFPLNKDIISQEDFHIFLNNLNKNHKVNTHLDEYKNVHYIYFDFDFKPTKTMLKIH